MSRSRISRRHFFFGSLLAGTVPAGGFGQVPSLKRLGFKSPNEKLNIAQIGAGGRGAQIVRGVQRTENVVALCDVNDEKAIPAYLNFPDARRYTDFRRMLDAEHSNIDAVMVATPDHTHTPASLLAMQHGKHVYCEKPLTRTVWEARLLRDAATKYGVATQMGNQGMSHEGTRTCAEILWSGEIGDVREVHAFTGELYGGEFSLQSAPVAQPVPDNVDWDLWLSTAATRPYNKEMVNRWRAFIDFSTGGSLGDWIVHCLGPTHLALQLHLAPPTSVECLRVEGTSQWTWPNHAHLRYEFPERGNMPPVTINVYQNMAGDWPIPDGMGEGENLLPPMNNLEERGRPAPPPPFVRPQRPRTPGRAAEKPLVPGNGALFVGDKGYMATVARGEGVWLLPASRWAEYELPPQLLPRSVNHQMDWVRACKGGQSGCSQFSVAVPYIEWLILGAVALRFPGERLQWDAYSMRFANNEEASKLIRPYIREGWEMTL